MQSACMCAHTRTWHATTRNGTRQCHFSPSSLAGCSWSSNDYVPHPLHSLLISDLGFEIRAPNSCGSAQAPEKAVASEGLNVPGPSVPVTACLPWTLWNMNVIPRRKIQQFMAPLPAQEPRDLAAESSWHTSLPRTALAR